MLQHAHDQKTDRAAVQNPVTSEQTEAREEALRPTELRQQAMQEAADQGPDARELETLQRQLQPRGAAEPDLARIAESGLEAPRRSLPHRGRLARSFGSGLGAIDVHAGSTAERAAASLGATAYTHRGSIVLGRGAGFAEVAEEAAHVLQQRRGAGSRMHGELTSPSSAAEQEASSASASVLAGRAVPPVSVGLGVGSIARAASSKEANKELNKRLGKAGKLFDLSVPEKPHTKKGTGRGGAEAHSVRDGKAVKKAKRKYLQETGKSPATLSASGMRSAEKGPEKDARAREAREQKEASRKALRVDRLLQDPEDRAVYESLSPDEQKEFLDDLELTQEELLAATRSNPSTAPKE